MRAWADVARLSKTRNLKGRFVAQAAAGLPFLLEEGDEVAFVPPQLDAPRRAVVTTVSLIDEHSAEIGFDCVDAASAQALVGSHCLIRRDCLDESVFEDVPDVWDGFKVVDGALGEIGVVAGVVDNPAQSLLEVAREDGAYALVPVVDEIVRNVNIDARIVYVSLPSGLLDL